MLEHEEALQAIADANGGNRAAGLPGYEASVDYVVETLEAAGWEVSIDEFPYTFVGPSTLQQLTPVNATYATGPYTGTGYGDVTAAVTPVDINLADPAATTSGCEAGDFTGFPVGNIALIQRGSCNFSVKALNAEAAGASAVIIFNQGTPDRARPRSSAPWAASTSRRHPRRRRELPAGRVAVPGRIHRAGHGAAAGVAPAEERHRRAPR